PSLIDQDRIRLALSEGRRIDNRGIDEFRDFTIKTGLIKKAEGSAHVNLGNTEVLAGVKVDIGTPYPDTPDSGVCTVMAEFNPMADPTFESGPPREGAIELARVVDRGIRHSDMVGTNKLCIVSGEKVYILFADAYILNNEGNLWDASALAITAALNNTQLPKVKINEDNSIEVLEETIPLKTMDKPVQVTFVKYGDQFLVDPSIIEEISAEARINISIDQNSNIVSMQKGGIEPISEKHLDEITDRAIKIAKKIRPKIP
ncbi:MAG: exosome complex protein Rrp42, partial [Candidatus Ranarchaeia archaeon]